MDKGRRGSSPTKASNRDATQAIDKLFDKLDDDRVEQIIRILNNNRFGQIFITDTNFDRIEAIMQKVDNNCKYFLFDKKGVYEEKFKD